jgi:hypothetical protein
LDADAKQDEFVSYDDVPDSNYEDIGEPVTKKSKGEGHGITFGIICRIITIGISIISIITIGSNIILGGKLNKRVFYYSVELFCLILLDYSVWKCIRRIFFMNVVFMNGFFF